MPTVFAFPPSGTNVPINVKLRALDTHWTLETSPANETSSYELKTGSAELVPFEKHVVADNAVELVPKADLRPLTDYELSWRWMGAEATPSRLASFRTGSSKDTTAPIITSVGAVTYHPASGEARTDCSPARWVDVPITVTDEGPVLIAAWFSGGTRQLDPTSPPHGYARMTDAAASIVLPADAKPPFVLVAIDAAGNRSAPVTVAAPLPPAPSSLSSPTTRKVGCACDVVGGGS